MWNHSKAFILFQWEKFENSCHIIEVAPSAGRIGVLHNKIIRDECSNTCISLCFNALPFYLFICCFFGIPEENECFNFDLILTGGKPEKVETMLVCNVQHHNEPVILPVEVSFKVRPDSIKSISSLLFYYWFLCVSTTGPNSDTQCSQRGLWTCEAWGADSDHPASQQYYQSGVLLVAGREISWTAGSTRHAGTTPP